MPQWKHLPARTCTACRRKAPKRELVRIVRTPYGNVLVDATGKQNGRGGYLCADPRCWEQALGPKRLARLEYALRGRIAPDDKAALLQYAATLGTATQGEDPHVQQPQ